MSRLRIQDPEDIDMGSSDEELKKIIAAVKLVHADFKSRKDFVGKFHFYLQDQFQFVILQVEACPYDLVDRFRARSYCYAH